MNQPKSHKKWWWLLLIIPFGVAALLLYKGLTNGSPQIAARGLANCSGKQLLINSPVKPKDISTIVPLGNLAPPGHVVPTVHMYYNYKQKPNAGNFPELTTLYVPADMTVTRIQLEDNLANAHPFNSYRIDFAICKQVTGYFYHPITLNPVLSSAIKPPYDQVQTSNVGTGTEHSYAKYVNIKLKAGEVLGTAGGAENLPDGLDFGLSDSRVTNIGINHARWGEDTRHYVCSLDYYPSALSSELYSFIGGFDYQRIDPGTPKCGTVYQDVAGTAQGNWFANDLPKTTFWDSNGQLALVHSNLNHQLAVFSLGNDSQKVNLTPAMYTFTPNKTGKVDLDFNLVKSSSVYCYDTASQDNNGNNQSILIQLTDATTLKIGPQSGTCGTGPWQFSQSLTYVR